MLEPKIVFRIDVAYVNDFLMEAWNVGGFTVFQRGISVAIPSIVETTPQWIKEDYVKQYIIMSWEDKNELERYVEHLLKQPYLIEIWEDR